MPLPLKSPVNDFNYLKMLFRPWAGLQFSFLPTRPEPKLDSWNSPRNLSTLSCFRFRCTKPRKSRAHLSRRAICPEQRALLPIVRPLLKVLRNCCFQQCSLFKRLTEGGLLPYRADRVDVFRRAATFTAKIFNEAKPRDLQALSLDIPRSLLLVADEIIE
jgi:hypothetical protein